MSKELQSATESYRRAMDAEIIGGGSIAHPGTPAQKAATTRAMNRIRKCFSTEREYLAHMWLVNNPK